MNLSNIKHSKKVKEQVIFLRDHYAVEFTKTKYGGIDYYQVEIEVKDFGDSNEARGVLASELVDEVAFILNAVEVVNAGDLSFEYV